MTKEERNTVRGLAAKNGNDLALGAAIWLGQELEYKEAVKRHASSGSRGVLPDAFAASVGAIVNEVESTTESDKAKAAAK